MTRGQFLSKDLVVELRQIVLEDYGLSLTEEQAFLMANQLTDLFENLLYGEEVNSNEAKKHRAQNSTKDSE
ncbi:MAG: hypothetical protein WCP14_04365 [bacterium]